MAITSNTYTGNGSNRLFSITFPYLNTTDIDVYLNGVLQTVTTQYTFANATTVEFVAAPANGAVVLLDRSTDNTTLAATFFPGSSIKAADLNENFDQVLYLAQETDNNVANVVAGQIPNGSITNVKLAADSVASSNIIDGTIVNADVNASAGIVATKLAFTQAGSGATARTVDSKLKETVSVKDFGAVGDGTTNDASAIQAAIDTGKGTIFFPAGTYLVNTSLNLKLKYVALIGDGTTKTIIKAGSAITNLVDVEETSDVIVSPFRLENLTIDGNSLATNGISIRYRHTFNLTNLVIQGCTVGIKEKDTWLNCHENVRVQSCATSWYLVGANHNSSYSRCSAIGFSSYGLRIEGLGGMPDGNNALLFSACDVEFGTGVGVFYDGNQQITFEGCYLGENVSLESLKVASGLVYVNGGTLFHGYTGNSIGVSLSGGKAIVRSCNLIAQGSLGSLTASTGGKVSFVDVMGAVGTGGDVLFTGDPFADGPTAKVFAERLGKNYTASPFNNTITQTVSGNAKTFTIATVTGSPSLLHVTTPILDKIKWMDGKTGYLTIVYSSNAAFTVRMEGGAFGGSPTKTLGLLASTSGVVKTLIKLDFTLDNAAYTGLTIYNDTAVATTSITIYDVFFTDYSFSQQTAEAASSNFYKG